MIRVQSEDFDVGALMAAFAQGDASVGAVATFLGKVRGGEISAMTLEHYPGMTEKSLANLEAEARQRWPLADVLILHRVGRLLPGDTIVFVATASAHRAAALESCEFLIDWLKTKAPFWKLEDSVTGPAWVAAKASDDAAAERWQTPPSGEPHAG
jgi:molybdopterin synthase catalytic subunit